MNKQLNIKMMTTFHFLLLEYLKKNHTYVLKLFGNRSKMINYDNSFECCLPFAKL